LPDRQSEHLFRLYVGLARTGAAAGAVTRMVAGNDSL
jgi:hypothetical protein